MSKSDDFIKKYLGEDPGQKQTNTVQQSNNKTAGSSVADDFIKRYNDDGYVNSIVSRKTTVQLPTARGADQDGSAYAKALRQYDYQQKYKGKTYDDIQAILSKLEPGEEYDWVSEYGKSTEVMTPDIYDRLIGEIEPERNALKKWNQEYEAGFYNGANDYTAYIQNQRRIKELDRELEPLRAGKWKSENEAKYSAIPTQDDFAEQSGNVSEDPTAIFGVQMGDNWIGFGDPIYDYINDIDGTREKLRYSGDGQADGDAALYKYTFMDDTEVATYNYIHNVEGKKAANEYLEYLSYELDARRKQKIAKDNAEFATEHPNMANLYSIAANLASGVGLLDVAGQNIIKGIKESATGEYAGPINYNSAAMSPSTISTSIRGTRAQNLADKYGVIQLDAEEHPILSKLLNGKSLGDVYQLGMSMADSATVALLSPVLGSFGTVLLGGSAGTQGMLEAAERGATDGQALTMGILNAAFEMLFEKVSLDNLLNGNTGNIITSVLKQGFIEGTEEFNTSLFNAIADTLVMAQGSNYRTSIDTYMKQGLSEEEATRQTLLDLAIQMGWDFVGGMISGGIMGGASTPIMNSVQQNAEAKALYGADPAGLVGEALELNPDSNFAQRMQGRLDAGKDISGRQLNKLAQQNETAIMQQDVATIEKAAASRLQELGETGDVNAIAAALAKQASGKKLTSKETQLIQDSKYGNRLSNELNPENIRSGEYSSAWAQQLDTSRINVDEYSMLLETAQVAQEDAKPAVSKPAAQMPNVAQAAAVDAAPGIEQESLRVSDDGKTIIQDTGEEATIKGIAKISDGRMTLMLDNGSTVDAQNIAYGSEGEALLYEAVASLDADAEISNILVGNYLENDGGVAAGDYALGMVEAFRYGTYNIPRSELESNAFAAKLTDVQRNSAYLLGERFGGKQTGTANAQARRAKFAQKFKETAGGKKTSTAEGKVHFDGDRGSLTERQSASLSAMEKMAEALGVQVYVFESEVNESGKHVGANGWYDPKDGSIHVDLHAGTSGEATMLFTLSHELTHFIKQWSPAKFKTLANFLMKEYGKKGVSVETLVRAQLDKAKQNGRTISYDTAYEEVIADSMEAMLADGNVMEKLAKLKQIDKTLWQKIKDFISELAAKIRKVYDGLAPDSVEGRYVAEMKDSIEKLQELFTEGLVDASENYQAAEKNTTQDGGEVQYSQRYLAADTNSEILAMVNKVSNGDFKANEKVYLGEVSDTIADQINKLTGLRVNGFKVAIEARQIDHILKDHGANGGTDHSMADPGDIAKMEYALTSPDDIRNAGKTQAYTYMRDGRNRTADTVLYEKKIGAKSYYVVQAVPDTKAKTLYIVTAFIGKSGYKKEASQLINAKSSDVTAKTGSANASTNSLRNDSEEVKSKSAEAMDLVVDSGTESVAPAVLFSERTWTESDYVQQRGKAAKEIAKAIGVSEKKAKAYIDSINSIAKMIADDRTRLDYFSSPGRSSFVGNVEYGGSFDFSTLCKKRRLLTGTFTAIQKALPNTALTANEILEIRNRMKDAGLEVSCGLCYVEGSRANMGQFAKEFLKLYKEYYPDAWQPNMADVNTPDGIEWVRINHPEAYEQYEYFWNHYGTLKPGDKNLFASQQKPKLYQLHTEYNGEILDKFNDDENVEDKNLNGGIRLQSFSDFEIVHLIDTMQIIMDMSRVGLAGQAYTKVPDFAWALGDTGLKINLSLIAKGVDADGKLIFDDVEGMPIDTAVALRNRYSKNVGTILVAFNDEQLLAAMADDRVDFIIPFHRSQWKKSQYEAMGLPAKTKDYTYMQNEKFIKPQYHEYRGRMVKDKATNYMPNEYWDFSKSGKENAGAYLEMCARNNKRPKFYKLLQNNGDGSYSLKADGSTDGYWKLLIDFKMYDNNGVGSPQMPVKPDFNMEEATRMLDEYQGGHSNFPVAQGIVYDFVQEYKDSHKGVKFSDRGAKPEEITYSDVMYSERVTEKETLDFLNNQETITTYKTMQLVDGKLYPPMAARTNGKYEDHSVLGTWEQATEHPELIKSGNKYKLDKGKGQGSIEAAYNPYMHSSNLVLNDQFSGAYTRDNLVTVECEVPVSELTSGYHAQYAKDSVGWHAWHTGTVAGSLRKARGIERKVFLSRWIKPVRIVPDAEVASMYKALLDGTDIAVPDNVVTPSLLKELKNAGVNIKESGRVKYSDRGNTPTFYSQMAKVVAGVKQEKLGAASVVNMLRGKGVKAEEIKWSGIEAFLDGKKSVTKAELQEFIAGSMLQIEEETLSDKELPYSQEHLDQIAKYEAERDTIVENLKAEWKRVVGTDIPIAHFGAGLEHTVVQKLLEANAAKKGETEAGYKYKAARAALQRCIEYNDDYFGFDNARQAFREAVRDPKDFLNSYEMTSFEESVFRDFIKAKEAYNKEQGIPVQDQRALIAIAQSADRFSNRILNVRSEHRAKEAKHMTKWSRYKLKGGSNYRELLFRMPDSLYSNDAMYAHWENRSGVLAHARIQDINVDGGRMLFVEELQSDWHNEGHKIGYEGEENKRLSNLENLRKEKDEIWDKLSELEPDSEEADALLKRDQKITEEISRLERASAEATPDAPFRDTYHEFVMKRLIRMAAEGGYDSIGWTPAQIQVERWSDEFAEGYRIEYDQDIPKFMNKHGKKWGAKVGKTTLVSGTEVWAMAITDSMKESVLADGQPLYSDRDTEPVSNRSLLANALESAAKNDIERKRLEEYRGNIDRINAEERKLYKLTAQIRDLSFAKGPKDTDAIRELQIQAKQTANRINTYDRKLLRLEASQPLQNVLEREKKAAYKKAEQKGKEALAAYRESALKTQREIIKRNQEARKRGVEGREKTAMRHKIQNVVGELNQLLLSNDKKRHVPDTLKKAVAEALTLVNMDTVGAEERAAKYAALIAKETDPDKITAYTVTMENILQQGEKLGQRLKDLRDAYEEISESDDPDIANAYDPVISGNLAELASSIGNTSLRNMTIEQLSDVYDMYRMVLTRVRDANKSFLNEKKESISNLASMVVAEVRTVGGDHKYRAAALDSIKKFGWNNMKPVYAFETIGSKTLSDAFETVRSGEDTWAKDISEAKAFSDSVQMKYGYQKWDFTKKHSFESVSGEKFDLTLEQILSLYAYSRREQAHEHLRLGGFVFDSNIETYKEKGSKLIKYKVNTADAHQISTEILANIISKLTDSQKSFVDDMQAYLSTTMGAKGNEVTMQMYGVKLFKEKFYFPLKSAKQFMFEQNEVSGEVKIKNSGFTNKTVAKANNPVILNNFMDVWASHVNDMSMYHAFVLPLEDFNRIFNYNSPKKEGQPPVSVKGTLQNAYTPAAVGYVKQLITDLNGGARSDPREGAGKALVGGFKKAAVFASASVVIQQPSAIGRALALVDAKYFLGEKIGKKRHKRLWAEVKQYAPVAVIKEMGYFDTDMGMSTVDYIKGDKTFMDKMDDTLSLAPAFADEVTWCHIWNAVKRETRAKNRGLQVNSDEFLQKAGKRFTEVIVKTQVYDSVLSRSANMRSKSLYMNMLTAFMAEPTTSINMLQDALVKAKRGNKKAAAKTVGAVYASVILNSVLVSFVYAARDDDEDETYWEKYLGSLAAELVDGVLPFGYLPIVKDVWSLLQGYDVERADMSLISTATETLTKLVKTVAVDTEDMDDEELAGHKRNVFEAAWGLVDAIASLTGIPVKNVRRDIMAVINTYKTTTNGLSGNITSTWDAVKESVKNSVPVVGWLPDEKTGDKLYRAIVSGDAAYQERITGMYDDQGAIDNAIRKALRDNDPRIREAAIAWNNNDLEEYLRIAKEIKGEKHFSQDNIVMAIRAEAAKLLSDDEGSSGTSKAKGLFTAEKFAAALADGDKALAGIIRDDIIETAVKNGKTRTDAEKSFESSANSAIHTAYDNKEIGEAQAVNGLVDFAGKSQEDAEEQVAKWSFENQYGFSYDDRDDAYLSGQISADELRTILMDVGGKTEEEANLQIVAYDWQREVPDADPRSITQAAVREYDEYCSAYNVPKDVYLHIRSVSNNTKNDVDANGKTIYYSAMNKIMAEINSQIGLTAEQKTAIARSLGWAEKNIQKYKLW